MILRTVRACLCLCLLLGARATATTLVGADLGELSRDATAIVRGRIASLDPRWIDGRRGIETIVTLETESALKGPSAERVQFVVPGGTIGRYRSIFFGAPQFAVGQHVVVFLASKAPAFPALVGLSQGVYRVTRGPGAEGDVVSVPAWRRQIAGAPAADPSRRAVRLSEFEQQVRQLAGGAR